MVKWIQSDTKVKLSRRKFNCKTKYQRIEMRMQVYLCVIVSLVQLDSRSTLLMWTYKKTFLAGLTSMIYCFCMNVLYNIHMQITHSWSLNFGEVTFPADCNYRFLMETVQTYNPQKKHIRKFQNLSVNFISKLQPNTETKIICNKVSKKPVVVLKVHRASIFRWWFFHSQVRGSWEAHEQCKLKCS